MFDIYREKKESRLIRILRRAGISLAAGTLLTVLIPTTLGAIWPYLRDEHYQPFRFAIVLVSVLNLPAVIYCSLFTLPESLPKSDESLYCYSVGFFFNPIYYAAVFFAAWWLLDKAVNRKKQTTLK
jgi:predicted Na+-dependent transporter